MGAIPASFRSATLTKAVGDGVLYADHYLRKGKVMTYGHFNNAINAKTTGEASQRISRLVNLGILDKTKKGVWKISDRFSVYLTALGKNEVEFNDVWEYVTAEVAPEPPSPEVNSDPGDEHDDQAEFLASEKRHFMDEDGLTDLPKVGSAGPQNKERTADQIAWDMTESKDGSKTVSVKTERAKRFQEAVTKGAPVEWDSDGCSCNCKVTEDCSDALAFSFTVRNAMNDALRSEWMSEAVEVLDLAKAELTPLSRKAVDDLLKRLPVEVKQ